MRKPALYALASVALWLCRPAGAETILVDSLIDDTLANLAANGTCDLREAIAAADTNAAVDTCTAGSGDDTIDLTNLSGTITVDPVADQLEVGSSIAFNGPGAGSLTISGGNMVRMFNIETFDAVAPPLAVAFRDLTLEGGSDVIRPGIWGGAIRHHEFTHGIGTLQIDNCVFTNNSVNGAAANGGALNSNVNTTIRNSLFTGNHAGDQAGALQLQFADFVISNTTLTGNTADGTYGGGIFLSGLTFPATLHIESSTISGNSVGLLGGGVAVQDAPTTLVNSTISGNSATSGGGISFLTFGTAPTTMQISHSTVADNKIAAGVGAGIVTFGFSTGTATVALENSIVADSTGGADCLGGGLSVINASAGYNIDDIDDGDTSCIAIAGPGNMNVDPGLDALADNGGATETHALMATSPALDGGGACTETRDQRDRPRPIGSACDIGAIESGQIDLGDAPDPSLPTLLASGGAYHAVSPLFLGASVDGDADGQPNATATGDDTDGSDDEDGVTFTSGLVAGGSATLDVTASETGSLDAWVDFDQDGSWTDPGEQIFAAAGLIAGVNNLSFNVPAGTSTGTTFARFRLSTAGGLAPDGPAADGEVEDYAITLNRPINVSIGDVSQVEGDGGGTTAFLFPVTIDANSIDVSLTVDSADISATAPADYTAIVAQSIVFPRGGPLSQTVTVEVAAEGLAEPDETFALTLSNPSSGSILVQADATGTVSNDDGTVSIGADLTRAEGSGGGTTAFSLDIGLSDPVTQTVTVDVNTVDGTATAGSDFTALAQTLTFVPGGSLTQTVIVDVAADDAVEGDEVFIVRLSGLAGRDHGNLRATLSTGLGDKLVVVGDTEATVRIVGDDANNASALEATKETIGTPLPHGGIAYLIVITNPGPGVQADNPGDEMIDVLPPELALQGAATDVGTVVADPGSNTVRWNGTLAEGESATVEIDASILIAGGSITNQAEVFYDTDNNGIHDASALSDDPQLGGPTTFLVPSLVEVPALSPSGLLLLALCLVAVGLRIVGRAAPMP